MTEHILQYILKQKTNMVEKMNNTLDNDSSIRERIIEVSRSIFARFGFKKTTMDEIAQAVNKAKSSIYHYFRSKEEIFQTVIEKEEEVLKEEISKAISQEDTAYKKLYAYVKTKTQTLERLVNFCTALKDEYLQKHYGFIEKIREKYHRYEIDLVKSILHNDTDSGLIAAGNIDDTALAITTALRGLEHPWFNNYEFSKIEENMNRLLEILFKGIKQE